MSLHRDAWCSVLRQCRPFEWYVLRCVCRVLYALVPPALIRGHCTGQWLSKHAARRDSVALLEWLHARHHAPPPRMVYNAALHAAARHDARRVLQWLLPCMYVILDAYPPLCAAAERGHLDVLQHMDQWWQQQASAVALAQRPQQLERLFSSAATAGHVHVLAWLATQCAALDNIQCYVSVLRAALRQRHYAVLRWTVTRGAPPQLADRPCKSLCKVAIRNGDVRALAWLHARHDTSLLDACAHSDAALVARLLGAADAHGYAVLYCAMVRDDMDTVRAQYPRAHRDACKWAHICCKYNAAHVLRWLAETQSVQQWHTCRHWPRLCTTAARRGHFGALGVLLEMSACPPWQQDTLKQVAALAPAHSVESMLAYCVEHGAPLTPFNAEDALELAHWGRVEALRWMRSRDMTLPRDLCDVARECRQPALMQFAHAADAPLCPWPAALCTARMHPRDAARYLAPHLAPTHN